MNCTGWIIYVVLLSEIRLLHYCCYYTANIIVVFIKVTLHAACHSMDAIKWIRDISFFRMNSNLVWFLLQGYRCFKMVMFFSGFTLSSAAVLLLYHKEPILDSRLRTETKAGISLGIGVLCGLMTMLVSTVGLLFSGLQLGSLISFAMLVVIGQFHSLTPVWVPLGTILALSIVAAVFMLHWQKFFTVAYTSVFGAALMVLCVDYLLGTFMLPDQVHDMLCEVAPRPFCWFNWVIAGIWPVVSFIGAMVQWRVTARGVSHTGEFSLHLLKRGEV